MKKPLIAANWKSNKKKNEAKNWLEEFSKKEFGESEIIIFPSFTLLDFVSNFIKEKSLPLKIGAQDISKFSGGPYTGEVNVGQIKDFCEFVLIGHSERRSNFQEDLETIRIKTENAISASLRPIICISNFDEARSLEFAKDAIFAYEPPESISTNPNSKPAEISDVSNFAQKFSVTFENELIYGGSVNAQNVSDYSKIDGISGFLVGGESLDPNSFFEIIKNAV